MRYGDTGGGEDVERWVREFCNKVWRGEEWPERWKKGVIVPIRKKGEGGVVEDYREVTLMSILYKVYVGLGREVEGRGGEKEDSASQPNRV